MVTTQRNWLALLFTTGEKEKKNVRENPNMPGSPQERDPGFVVLRVAAEVGTIFSKKKKTILRAV